MVKNSARLAKRNSFRDITSVEVATEAILSGANVSSVLNSLYKNGGKTIGLARKKRASESMTYAEFKARYGRTATKRAGISNPRRFAGKTMTYEEFKRFAKSGVNTAFEDEEVDVPQPELTSNPALDIIDAAVSALPEDVETPEEVSQGLTEVADFVETLPDQSLDNLVSAINDFGELLKEEGSEPAEESVRAIRAKYSKVLEEEEDVVDTGDAAEIINAVADNIPEEATSEEDIQEYLDDVSEVLADTTIEDSVDAIQNLGEEDIETDEELPISERRKKKHLRAVI